MLLLTGEYQHTVDGKGRVLVSNKLRNQIDVDLHGANFYLVLGANGVLCLYPEKCFERLALSMAPGTTAPDGWLCHYLRTFFFPATVFFGPLLVRALVWVR